ncbi:hypothetical protein D046_1203B, partial [Vibrio parahaemolyticus V-223/04]
VFDSWVARKKIPPNAANGMIFPSFKLLSMEERLTLELRFIVPPSTSYKQHSACRPI